MANVKWLDATIWTDDVQFPGEEVLRIECDRLFERYAYGRESAPSTGKRHLQFRGVLRSACDSSTLGALCALGFRNVTPTHVKNFDYVYKDGDFYCSWEVWRPEFDWLKDNWKMWMTSLQELDRDGRTIEVLVDPKGNAGKTAFAMLMHYEHRAVYCPPFESGKELVSFALQARSSPWYIVDLPRAFEIDSKWASAIEQLKNGYIYDSRYSFREKMLPVRPRVTLMSNWLIDDIEKYFSVDRVLNFEIRDNSYLWMCE